MNASLLWLIPCLPLLGAVLIGLGNRRLSRKVAGAWAAYVMPRAIIARQ